MARLDEVHRRSLEEPEAFWAEAAAAIDWTAPWERVLVCGDYLSPVEIPTLSPSGSRDAYLATLERLRPLATEAEWVVPGHGAPIDGARALAILSEDVRYLTDWELPLTRRTAAQRAVDAENRQRAGEAP